MGFNSGFKGLIQVSRINIVIIYHFLGMLYIYIYMYILFSYVFVSKGKVHAFTGTEALPYGP